MRPVTCGGLGPLRGAGGRHSASGGLRPSVQYFCSGTRVARVGALRELVSAVMASQGKSPRGNAPIHVDADMDNAGGGETDNRQAGQSPHKKRERPADAAEPMPAEGLTLADLQLALAPVLQGLQSIQGRMQTVETQVSQKLDSALNVVRTLDDRRKEQGTEIQKSVSTLQHQAENQKTQEREMKDMIARLEVLEQKVATGIWKASPGMQEDGCRSPALIVGGWHDQEADRTTQNSREYLQKLGVPLELRGLFTPGIRRGYSILPVEPKEGEDARSLYQRLAGVVAVARTVKEYTEATNGKGQAKQVWVAISQPPEQRRKSRFAGKVKRLVLEAAETLAKTMKVQAEYRAGTVWVEGKRVASATAPKVGATLNGSHGWIDVAHIAAILGTHEAESQGTMARAGTAAKLTGKEGQSN